MPSRSTIQFPEPIVQYLVLPYARLVAQTQIGTATSFNFGGYDLWQDMAENWQRFLKLERPANHLSMYVGKDGLPLNKLWIATPPSEAKVDGDDWSRLVAALFYICFNRGPFLFGLGRPAADDFRFDAFDVPKGASTNSSSHVRLTKYGMNYVSDVKLYPSLDVSFNQHRLLLPGAHALGSPDLLAIDLFLALDKELEASESRILSALTFFFRANFRSHTQSSWAEDIQNICTAFEALLDIQKKGYSAEQVADKLRNLFLPTAPSPFDD